MSGNEGKKIDSPVKVGEFIKIIKANETFLSSVSPNNKNLVIFLRKLRQILAPLKNVDGKEFLEALRRTLKVYARLGEVESIPLDKLKTSLISEENWSTKELLYIAEKRLEIPTGSLKNMRKEDIKTKIMSTIQNIQKLDAIQKKASE